MKSNNNLKTLMVKNGFQVHDELFDFADIVIKNCINIIRKEDTPEDGDVIIYTVDEFREIVNEKTIKL
jgi:hypothetical protein